MGECIDMVNSAKMQLIGGLRLGSANDDSFYDELLTRLPSEVKNTGNLTRYVAFDYLTDQNDPITFLGIEVDSIENIPEGMYAWILDNRYLTVLEGDNGKNAKIWQEGLTWRWRDESPSKYNRDVTGEFAVRVPAEWYGDSKPGEREFSMTVNMYIAPGQAGSDDNIHLVDYNPEWPGKSLRP